MIGIFLLVMVWMMVLGTKMDGLFFSPTPPHQEVCTSLRKRVRGPDKSKDRFVLSREKRGTRCSKS